MYRIACVGDSIVAGAPYGNEYGFPAAVMESTGWELRNYGMCGALSGEVLADLDRALELGPDVLLILCGTNDACNAMFSARVIWANLKEIAARGRAAGAQPIIMIPVLMDSYQGARDWGALGPVNMSGTEGTAEEQIIAQFDAANARVRELRDIIINGQESPGIPYIDLQEKYSECRRYYDGIHPDAEGYRFIGGFVTSELRRILG